MQLIVPSLPGPMEGAKSESAPTLKKTYSGELEIHSNKNHHTMSEKEENDQLNGAKRLRSDF